MSLRTLDIVACLLLICLISVLMVRHRSIGAMLDAATGENVMAYAEISTTTPQQPLTVSPEARLRLPILVYHIVRPSDANDSAAVKALAVTPELFDEQLQWLQDAHYTVVHFSDLEAYYAHGKPLPPHPLILCFDDGWVSQFIYAFPILEKHHLSATFFVFTNAIGRPGFFTWDNLKQLLAAGMSIGDHSRSHPYLTKIASPKELRSEIYDSKQILESHLGVSIDEFAYPFGQYDASTTALVKAAGFKSARGDFYSGEQSADRLYALSALNAPVTMREFKHWFPAP